MTTATEMREGLVAISTTLGNAVTGAASSTDPYATLVGSIDQTRAFINQMAAKVTDELHVGEITGLPAMNCFLCINQARTSEALGQEPPPILPASTVTQGMAICDAEGRHRILIPPGAASGLVLPGQNGIPNAG